MSDKEPNAVILRPASGVKQLGSGAERVLSRVVGEALALARAREPTRSQTLIRVGNFEFREEDYRQIVIWADGISKTADELVSLFEKEELLILEDEEKIGRRIEDGGQFIVEDGYIRSIQFKNHLLFPWVWPWELSKLSSARVLRVYYLSKLEKLGCDYNGLTQLDLSPISALTSLNCQGNNLTELDLSPVPTLTSLNCGYNNLTELDLSPVPTLASLNCSSNDVARLDLSAVPMLTTLDCRFNQLTKLDLSPVPMLIDLRCRFNPLKELDLSPTPTLKFLDCERNQLTELDLSHVPGLTRLHCDNPQEHPSRRRRMDSMSNRLTTLDLAKVPALKVLRCKNNEICELDVRGNPQLKVLSCDPSVKIIKHDWQSFTDAR